VNLHGLDAAEELLGLAHGAAVGELHADGVVLPAMLEEAEDERVEAAETEGGADREDGINEEQGGKQEQDGEGAAEPIEQREEDAADHRVHVADRLFEEFAGISLEEVAVGIRGHAGEQPQAQPVAEALCVADADDFAEEEEAIGQEEHGDGEAAGPDEQGAIRHFGQE
jgi:hypothetical protein